MITGSISCFKSLISFELFFVSLKFVHFELNKNSVASFGIGVNIKLEKDERLCVICCTKCLGRLTVGL